MRVSGYLAPPQEPKLALGSLLLACVTEADSVVAELAWIVRDAGAVDLTDRLVCAVTDGSRLIALTIDSGRSLARSKAPGRARGLRGG